MFDNEFVPQETVLGSGASINFAADAPTVQSEAIDFSADKPLQSLPLSVTDNRAAKAHFAMGERSPGADALKSAFASGGEWDTRVRMADNKQMDQQSDALAMVNKLISDPTTTAVTPLDASTALNVMKVKQVDPSSVIEGEFAKAFTHFGATIRPDINNIFSKGWQQFPGATAFEQYVAVDLGTKKQLTTSIKEEYEDRWKKFGWFQTQNPEAGPLETARGVDAYALSSLPFVSWTRMSDVLGKVPGIFPGTNMANTIRALWATSNKDDFNTKLRTAAEALWKKNPLDALVFVRAAESFSDSEETLGNVFGWADIATVAPIGSILKGGKLAAGLFSSKRIAEAPKGLVVEDIANSPVSYGMTDRSKGVSLGGKEAPIATPKGESFEPVQLDLFNGDPRQGDLFAGSRPGEGVGPPATAGLPPGKLRSTYQPLDVQDANIAAQQEKGFRNPFTGRMEKPVSSREQLELPLGRANTQLSMFERLFGEGSLVAETAAKDDLVGQVRQALGDVVKASGDKGKIDPEIVFNRLGDTETASKIGVNRINQILAELDSSGAVKSQPADINGLYQLGKDLPSSFNPVGLDANPVNTSRARSQTIAERLKASGNSFMSMLGDSMGVERLTPEALEAAYKDAAETLKFEFHTNQDYILDGFIKRERDVETNTRESTILMGNRGKLPFESKEQAETFARDIFGVEGRSTIIEQKGIGYYVAVSKPLDEGASTVRDLLVTTKFSQIPINRWSNLIFGTWNPRSAEDLLSRHIQEAAHTATHSPQNMRAFFKGMIEENITNLSKRDRTEVQDVLRANRDTEQNGKRGIFAKSAGEFDTMFYGKHGYYPTPEQTNAYFTFIQLNDMDWVLRNTGVLRDKLIKGIEEHAFTVNGTKTPWLEGKILRKFPSDISEDSGVLIVRQRDGAPEYIRRHDPNFDTKTVHNMMEEGYQLVQLAEPHTRPLMGLTGEKDTINFVLTNTKETRPLPWKQMEYQPGGHVIYSNNHWVKQAQIAIGRDGKAFYYGDNNYFNFSSGAEAKYWSDKYNEAFKLFGDKTAFDTYVNKNLPHTPQELHKMVDSGYINPELPFMHAESGMNTVRSNPEYFKDRYKSVNGLRNDVDSQFNLYQGLDKTFLADRDYQLGTIMPNGDQFKPWKIERSPAIDPYPALNQALGQAMRARYMNDYKVAASEAWVQQFGHLLPGGDKEAFRKNPLAALYNSKITNTTSKEEMMAAENARQRIIDFIGSSSEFDRNLNRIQNIVADAAYNKGGSKVANWMGEKIIPWLSDPTEAARALAFHSHLGMFNPVQLWVQMQTMANSIAIAGPTAGVNGAVVGTLMHFLGATNTSEAMINKWAQMASKVTLGKVNEDIFKELYAHMNRTGLWHVGGETAWRDSVMDPKLYQSAKGQWIDKSTVFFNTGERQARLTADASAFLEWRFANPNAELTNKIENSILARSDTLSANMTRASNANWQKGITSVPLQFQAYTARMMEQMTFSTRLTATEKMRAFATYSALYGVPVTLGATTGMNWYDDIRKGAADRGIDLSPAYVKGMMEGLPSLLFSTATGKDYNWATRMGPNGNLPTIPNVFSMLTGGGWKPNKSIDEILGGASWQTVKDIGSSMYPFGQWAYHYLVNQDTSKFPLMVEDLAGIASNSSTTWSNTMKMMWGLYSGQYVTKNDMPVTEITKLDAMMIPIFGVQTKAVQETFERADILKERKNAQEKFQQLALTEYRRAQDRWIKFDDTDGFKDAMKKAHAYLGAAQLNEQEKIQFWQRANAGVGQTMKEKIDQDWLKHAPAWAYPSRVDKKAKQ